jgi:hypothetical protein
MSPYVILRQGGQPYYVNQPGSGKSYTRDKFKARRFDTREAAQADCCGNEIPVALL